MFDEPSSDYSSPMKARSLIRICAVCLGLWMALTPTIIAAPVAAMADHADMSGSGCDPRPDADMDGRMCASICLGALPFVPSDVVGLFAVIDIRHWLGQGPPLSGRVFMPDPAPPRSHSLL